MNHPNGVNITRFFSASTSLDRQEPVELTIPRVSRIAAGGEIRILEMAV
jgi:hypothetical protein